MKSEMRLLSSLLASEAPLDVISLIFLYRWCRNSALSEFLLHISLTLITQLTVAVIAFLHTMFLFPNIAAKVQKEIDTVTNGQRLLQVTDRPNLPFTEAAWKEAWRWHPFLPMGEW